MATTQLLAALMNGESFRKQVCLRMHLLFVGVFLVGGHFPAEGSGLSIAHVRVYDISDPKVQSLPLSIVAVEGAPPSMVGSIMALLATLEDTGVLPPEGTSQANQLIHGLIQLQSAFLKSSSPELSAYLRAAEKQWRVEHQDSGFTSLAKAGLTSRVLEALIFYDKVSPMWENPKVVAAVQGFNVTHSDWVLIVDLVSQAEKVFNSRGQSLHGSYDQWRVQMPGGQL